VDAPASSEPNKDKQHEYQPNDKWATYSGAKGESQSAHPLCFVRHFPECDDAAYPEHRRTDTEGPKEQQSLRGKLWVGLVHRIDKRRRNGTEDQHG
jgi:hypothetical protein